MGGFIRDVLLYLIGGVTFIPLVVVAVLLYIFFTSHPHSDPPPPTAADELHDRADDGRNIRRGSDANLTKLRRTQEKEIGGYFAVCREWIPGGVNGKPPERTTPAGEVIAEESPSVYQSMYRSLFDRRQTPTLDVTKTANGKPLKRTTNVFYVVLRHGHLMLYDDSEQVEVRHVISLAYHDVAVYGGGDVVPEGELWIKRNAICLSRKAPITDSIDMVSKPFYLFSENCSEKEDFYFAILQHQERTAGEDHPPPLVQHYETKHIIKLVQTLHSSEEHLQTRWFNALLGRLFLSVYKTPEVERFVRAKITKKIARANKPSIISGIKLKKIDLGDSAPWVTNPKLKDLTVDGDCCVEADVRYEGKFRIEIATTAKLDLGTRFKAREFNLVLAITVKKLEGHAMLRFKPPPSNRLWYSFEKMPRMELQIEPIVSSRHITWGIIHRAIESRIREVFAETLVVPHWDDSPFFSTLDQHFRGGIWVHELQHFQAQTETIVPDETVTEGPADDEQPGLKDLAAPEHRESDAKSVSEKSQPFLFRRKPVKSNQTGEPPAASASSTSVQKTAEAPRAMRSNSFARAASPIVSPSNVASDTVAIEPSSKNKKDAASFMSEISSRSQPSSPRMASPMRFGSQEEQPYSIETAQFGDSSSHSISESVSKLRSSSVHDVALSGTRKTSDASTTSKDVPHPQSTRLQNVARTLAPSAKKQQSLGAAALAAKSWGWKTLAKGNKSPASPSPTGGGPGLPKGPMGRGQPFPPRGQPLPHPGDLKAPPAPKQSPDPPRLPPRRPQRSRTSSQDAGRHLSQAQSAPLQNGDHEGVAEGDGIMVIAAPIDSGPSSPALPDDDSYGEFMANVRADDESERHVEVTPPHAESASDEATEARMEVEHPPESEPPFEMELPSEAEGGGEGAELEPPAEEIEYRLRQSPETDDDALHAAWKVGEEAEARSRSVWMDEPEFQ